MISLCFWMFSFGNLITTNKILIEVWLPWSFMLLPPTLSTINDIKEQIVTLVLKVTLVEKSLLMWPSRQMASIQSEPPIGDWNIKFVLKCNFFWLNHNLAVRVYLLWAGVTQAFVTLIFVIIYSQAVPPGQVGLNWGWVGTSSRVSGTRPSMQSPPTDHSPETFFPQNTKQ